MAVADQPQKPKVSKLKLMSASSKNPRLGDAITEAVRDAYSKLPEGVTPSFMKLLLSSSYCSGNEADQVEDVPEIRLDDLGQVVTPTGLTNVIDVIARLFAKVSFPPCPPFPSPLSSSFLCTERLRNRAEEKCPRLQTLPPPPPIFPPMAPPISTIFLNNDYKMTIFVGNNTERLGRGAGDWIDCQGIHDRDR